LLLRCRKQIELRSNVVTSLSEKSNYGRTMLLLLWRIMIERCCCCTEITLLLEKNRTMDCCCFVVGKRNGRCRYFDAVTLLSEIRKGVERWKRTEANWTAVEQCCCCFVVGRELRIGSDAVVVVTSLSEENWFVETVGLGNRLVFSSAFGSDGGNKVYCLWMCISHWQNNETLMRC